jgi:medium-chain acyl-[acyl-carrier-protein] hydrolase
MYRGWAARLPPSIEPALVHLPGRESRIAEPAARRLDALADAILEGLKPHLQGPFALGGLSMGALLSFEVARRLHARGMAMPEVLLAMAHRAPHLPYPRPPVYAASEAELLAEMHRIGGTPKEVLDHPDLMALLMPIIRADMEVCETYTFKAAPPLPCPILAYAGAQDPDVPPESMEGWAQHTRGGFKLRVFPGDHFFIAPQEAQVIAAFAEDVGRKS